MTADKGPQTAAGRLLLESLPLDDWHPINRDIVIDHILAIEAEAGPGAPAPDDGDTIVVPNLAGIGSYRHCDDYTYRRSRPPAPEFETVARWWVASHLSDAAGQRAATNLSAFFEDWWDGNMDEPWPLPRVERL